MRGLRQSLVVVMAAALITLILWVVYMFSLYVNVYLSTHTAKSHHNPPATVPPKREEIGSLVFTGDVMLGRYVERIITQNGIGYVFAGLASHVNPTDRFVINFEASIPERHIPTPDFTFQFSVPENTVQALADYQVSYASLANNHAYDFGLRGFQNTQRALSEADITPFGHPYALATSTTAITTLNGHKVALIGISTLGYQPSNDELMSVMEFATSISDIQIISVHWGEEYNLTQSSWQRSFAQTLVAAGADLIIGHHPHVVQGIEVIDGVPVLYSLGNFIFDQYFSTHVQQGLMVSVSLTKADELKLNLIPVSSLDSVAQPKVMQPDEAAQMLRSVSLRSGADVALAVSAGELLLPLTLATSP